MGRRGSRPGSSRGVAARLLAALAVALLGSVAPQPVLAQASAAARTGKEPFVVTADKLIYDTDKKTVTATGDVEISSGERRLLADQVVYDQTTGRMVARGNVVLIEPSGDATFADEAEVTGDLREGMAKSVAMLMKDESRLAAAQGTRREGRIVELEKAVYSPCPICKDGTGGPLWQIKSRRVIYDQDAQTVSYRDARLELFGLPFLYTPYFRHPAPGVEQQSGFLTPTFGTTSETGLITQVPYYFALSPSADFTFAPIFTQTAGVVLAGEYRQQHRDGFTRLAASGTYAEMAESDQETEQGKELRGHVKADGDYGATRNSRAGYNIFLSSDKTYLDRYKLSDEDVLRNRVYFEGFEDRNFWTVDGYYFQGLRTFDDQDRIPVALPYAQTRLISQPLRWGSVLTLDSSVLGLTRSKGLDTRRLSTRFGWTVPHVGAIGDVYRLDLSLRGDAYNTDGDPQTLEAGGGTNSTGRVLPRATLDWSWPLADMTDAWVHEVEPMVSFTMAPADANSSEIPNEDSRVFELDETNLFEPSRYPGLDRFDGGTKVAYGLRFSSLGPRATELSGVFGQSYAFSGGTDLSDQAGVGDGFSDYVGGLYVRPSPLLDLSYRFRLAKDELRFHRSEALAALGPAFLRFNVGYVNLSKEPGTVTSGGEIGTVSREELVLGARAQLTPRIAIGAQTRQDLSAHQTVANQLGLLYTHPCLVLAAGFEQRFTPDAKLGNETVFLVRIAFENLGAIEAGGGLFGSQQ
ncbi:LPS-assembly protein LptD [Benzoatithermus flavus]|uniref:LPS-assembly protein LptD n=1 Tax=Benzoatithermus flavus TaxID=3108223 RepID=A0ABU8XMN7_9PROT